MRGPDHGFFVGYFKSVPPAVKRFSLAAGVALVSAFVAAAVALAVATGDPGSGRFDNELGPEAMTGVLEQHPYPILRVPALGGRPARAVMLSGQGKAGVQDPSAALAGKTVEVGGVFVKRGDVDILLVGGRVGLRAAEGDPPPPEIAPAVPLGRWRLTGEICDGKCYAGAMKPGRGLAHKACANLCITGGLPPVLVMALPVEGATMVLLADRDGGPLPDAVLDYTATPVEIEGTLERRDDLLVFRVDTDGVKVL
ncbi:MAG TPA: hypothetical protein VMP03_15260 [Methylomirabilota bacterium]|nr:hypothetical protein [Methylomirabilota bacterium]